jgi:hypothetical protein
MVASDVDDIVVPKDLARAASPVIAPARKATRDAQAIHSAESTGWADL